MGGVEDGVGDYEARDRCTADDVRVDDFVYIFGLDASIPDCFGVDHYGWSEFTLVEAAGFIGADVFYSALCQLGFEEALQFALPGGVAAAARMAWFALVHANEDVFVELRHGYKFNSWVFLVSWRRTAKNQKTQVHNYSTANLGHPATRRVVLTAAVKLFGRKNREYQERPRWSS